MKKMFVSVSAIVLIVSFGFISCTDGNNSVNSSSTAKLSKASDDGSGVKAIEDQDVAIRPCVSCQVGGGGNDVLNLEKSVSQGTYDSTDWTSKFAISLYSGSGYEVQNLTFYCGGVDGNNQILPEFIIGKGFWVDRDGYQAGDDPTLTNTLTINALDGERWGYTWIISNQGANPVTVNGSQINFTSSRFTNRATDLPEFINVTLIARDDALKTWVYYMYIAVESHAGIYNY